MSLVFQGFSFVASEGRKKRRFAYMNINVQPARPVNKGLENNTHIRRVLSLSTLVGTMPLVLLVV